MDKLCKRVSKEILCFGKWLLVLLQVSLDPHSNFHRNKAEVTHTCRGTIDLASASIEKQDTVHINVTKQGSPTFHLRTLNENDCKKWYQALRSSKARAISLRRLSKRLECGFHWSLLSNLNPKDPKCPGIYDLFVFTFRGDSSQKLVSGTAPLSAYEADDSEGADDEYYAEDANMHIEKLLAVLETKANCIQNCQMNLSSRFEELNKVLKEFEANAELESRVKMLEVVNEKATMFNVSSLTHLNSCKAFTQQCQIQGKKLRRLYNLQKESEARLDSMVEDLAKQLKRLENKLEHRPNFVSQSSNFPKDLSRTLPGRAVPVVVDESSEVSTNQNTSSEAVAESSDEEFDFFDAQDTFCLTMPAMGRSRESLMFSRDNCESELSKESATGYESDVSIDFDPDAEDDGERNERTKIQSRKTKQVQIMTSRTNRSTTLTAYNKKTLLTTDTLLVPVRVEMLRRKMIMPRPNYSLNLWSIMKNCIGKELSKIPMPVNFSEPISMLQRLTEDFEYSYLLDRAATCTDSTEAMAYVAAFTVSAYASTAIRTNKPFNPILGETFECDRTDDLGWRSLAEQISHHPPKAALHCESNLWEAWFDFSMTSKFRGKYLQIQPIGTCHLKLRKSGHHYTWHKIPMTVHNIIVGRLWIDNSGEMDIVNHNTKEKCHLSYTAYSFFSSDTHKRGAVTNAKGDLKYVLNGTWDQYMECCEVMEGKKDRSGKETFTASSGTRLWEAKANPVGAETMYNFSEFAITLNDPNEEGIAPTDSRLRTDQKLMEAGRWDEANVEKVRLEEKQRDRRRKMAVDPKPNAVLKLNPMEFSANISPQNGSESSQVTVDPAPSDDRHHKPVWFESRHDPDTTETISFFTNEYWQCKERQDWSRCPDLY
ncbi:hypothetical protein Ciccas_000041 [Cichlidogyrus casuarinus]|uniref:Oxysterol-binding protein n=1 Tax=Cichlidogyrus casuarinus TaxID=1844966 RepID=A0ABD2QP33_9PLAT